MIIRWCLIYSGRSGQWKQAFISKYESPPCNIKSLMTTVRWITLKDLQLWTIIVLHWLPCNTLLFSCEESADTETQEGEVLLPFQKWATAEVVSNFKHLFWQERRTNYFCHHMKALQGRRPLPLRPCSSSPKKLQWTVSGFALCYIS